MRESNFAQQLSAAARFSASSEACATYSVQATTPQLARDPEREEAMPFKRPQAPVTAVEARASATLSETAQNAADPASVIPPSTRNIPAHITKPASAAPSAILSMQTCPTPRQLAPMIQLALCPAFTQSRTASPIQPVYPPRSACDTSSIPASARDLHSVPSSVRFSIPERPQLALQVPQTPTAIQSWLRRLRSHPSHPVSAHEPPRTQGLTPASSRTPSLCFVHFASPHDEAHSTQPSSDEQSVNRRRVTEVQLPFRPRKPPDMVRRACAMLARF